MRKIGMGVMILVLGALVLSPAIAAMGLDPVPGDIAFAMGNLRLNIPVAYSLCASAGITLLYYFLKR